MTVIIISLAVLAAIAAVVWARLRAKRKTYKTPTSILPLIMEHEVDNCFGHYRSGGIYINDPSKVFYINTKGWNIDATNKSENK